MHAINNPRLSVNDLLLLSTPTIPAFEEFPKMARLSRECVITEKIDGTNAQIYIEELRPPIETSTAEGGTMTDRLIRIHVGSRNRWLSEKEDNFGFYRWAMEHKTELVRLGPGRHYGEWWGSGIQRGYGLPKGEKRFSLFNTSRWRDSRSNARFLDDKQQNAPECCHVVPELYRGIFDQERIEHALNNLCQYGSAAAPGFTLPEGVVVYHTAANLCFKKTILNDEKPKSQA